MTRDLSPSDVLFAGPDLRLEEGGQVTWAAAGHEPPLRVSLAGQVTAADLTPVGMPLGIDPDEKYSTVRWQLVPGERLLLFTDGLWEVHNRAGHAFGRRGLQRELAACASLSL